MRKILIWILVLLLIALALVTFVKFAKDKQGSNQTVITTVFVNDTGESVPASFDTTAGTVTFTEASLGTVTLPQAISASGARYANEDESVVFWNKGDEVTIEYNGEVVFTGSTEVNEDDRETDTKATEETMQPSVSITGTVEMLDDRAWVWTSTTLANGTVVTPKKADAFKITFADGRVQGTTDCNNFFGPYTINENKVSFGALASTLMFCEGSQEQEYLGEIAQVESAAISADSLKLMLKDNAGTMQFVPAE